MQDEEAMNGIVNISSDKCNTAKHRLVDRHRSDRHTKVLLEVPANLKNLITRIIFLKNLITRNMFLDLWSI